MRSGPTAVPQPQTASHFVAPPSLPRFRSILSDACETNRTAVTKAVDAVCSRLVTLFTALNEFPVIR